MLLLRACFILLACLCASANADEHCGTTNNFVANRTCYNWNNCETCVVGCAEGLVGDMRLCRHQFGNSMSVEQKCFNGQVHEEHQECMLEWKDYGFRELTCMCGVNDCKLNLSAYSDAIERIEQLIREEYRDEKKEGQKTVDFKKANIIVIVVSLSLATSAAVIATGMMIYFAFH